MQPNISTNRLFSRTRIILLTSMTLLLLAGIPPVRAYTLLTPGTKNSYLIQSRRGQMTLVLSTDSPDERDSIRVEQSGRRGTQDLVLDPVGEWKTGSTFYLHYRLLLRKGSNRFRIFPDEREIKIRYRPIRTIMKVDFEAASNYLFHRKDITPKACRNCHTGDLPENTGLDSRQLLKNSDYSPECYSCHRQMIKASRWRHGPAANVYCKSCHQEKKGATAISILTGRVEEVCARCHINTKKFSSQAHVHGPVGTGDCTVCHDPHGDRYKFQLWADGRSDLCTGCHTDKKNAMNRRVGFYMHGIIQGGGCVACHDPHASDTRFQLYRPINELCTSCHMELQGINEGHPVGNHPLKGRPDPLRKNRELSCTSCHKPHGSGYRFFLIGDLLGGHVCSKCHT